MTELLVTAALAGLVGLGLLALCVTRLRRRRALAACGHGAGALVLLALAGALAAASANLYTYQRLTHERDVATLTFRQLGPQRFEVVVRRTGHPEPRRLELQGDEWQIDARVLKWRGVVHLLGLDTLYRIERLSGRYRDVGQERSAPRSVFALGPSAAVDLWAAARRYERWLPWVDASYGSAAYLPMADGARFRVRMTQSGLLARPLNGPARAAVREWR